MSRRTYRWLPAQVCRTARYWVALSVVLSLVGTAAIAQDFDPSDAASVMPTTRYEFNGIYDSVVDLRVKVLGGFITVHRTYNRGNTPESQLSALFGWDINPELSELRAVAPIRQECGTGVPDKMVRGRTSSKYERIPGSCPARYTRDDGDKTITMTVNGWRWESRAGDWVDYDNVDNSSPKPTAYGDRNGLIASILRDGLGRLIGFADRLGRQVVTFDWASPDSLLVRDYAGRQVSYGLDHTPIALGEVGHLAVTDVRGNVWTEEWLWERQGPNGETRNLPLQWLSRMDPEGRTTRPRGQGAGVGIIDEDDQGVRYVSSYDEQKETFTARELYNGNRIIESWTHVRDGLVRRDLNGRTVMTARRDGEDRVVTDENGNQTRLRFDGQHRLVGIDFADGSTTRVEIAPAYDLPRSVTDANGVTTRFEYDAAGNLVRMVEAAGRPEERVTLSRYDQYGQVIEQREVVDGGSGDRVTTFTYDSYGNLAGFTDAEGNVYAMDHDVMGNVTRITDPRGKVWQYEYDAAGNLLRATDPLGAVQSYEYDRVGNLVRVTDEAGAVTQYFYNRQDRVVRIVDALQNEWRYEYAESGELKSSVDPEGHRREYAYDRDGHLVSATDGEGNNTRVEYLPGRTASNPSPGLRVRWTYPTFVREWQYDNRDRVAASTDIEPGGRRLTTRWGYDRESNLISTTSPDSRRSEYTYDSLDRLIRELRPDGTAVRVQRDLWEQTVSVTDPRDLMSVMHYDKLGRRLSDRQPGGALTRFSYDPAGNLAAVVDARNQEVRYAYDDAGRLQFVRTYPVAGGSTPSRTIQFGRDARGLLTSYTDGATSASAQFDALQRLLSLTVNFGPFASGVQYSYLKNGLMRSHTAADGAIYGYAYDGNDQLETVTIPAEGAISVAARTWTAPAAITLPGGSRRELEYDARLLVKRQVARDAGGNALLDDAYRYDDVDNLTERTTEGGTFTYGYDALSRLTAVGDPVAGDQSYRYDPAGNRMPGGPAASNSWSYGSNNELRSAGSLSYEYDAAGNLVRRIGPGGERRFAYDELGQLVRVEDGNGTEIARYGYDPFGQRQWKEVGGARTYFLNTPAGLAAELDAGGSVTRTYGYDPASASTSGPLFMREGATYGYFHNDHLGTPRKITDRNGAVLWSASYDAFGRATVDLASVSNPHRYPGQYEDPETGLHYNRFRYYDPAAGRYLTPDPIGLDGGVNRYTYAAGNPVNWTDTLGLKVDDCAKELGGPRSGACPPAGGSPTKRLCGRSSVPTGPAAPPSLRLGDQTGPSDDVNRMIVRLRQEIDLLDKTHFRRPGRGELNGAVNNFEMQFLGKRYLYCTEQAYVLKLSIEGDFGDKWSFVVKKYTPWHQVLFAYPANATEPIVILDPWASRYQLVPRSVPVADEDWVYVDPLPHPALARPLSVQ